MGSYVEKSEAPVQYNELSVKNEHASGTDRDAADMRKLGVLQETKASF